MSVNVSICMEIKLKSDHLRSDKLSNSQHFLCIYSVLSFVYYVYRNQEFIAGYVQAFRSIKHLVFLC